MRYRTLGRTGVKVSELCLGTLTFGREADERASAAIFGRCRDAGVNFFDTADVYSGGRAESILGGLVAGSRAEVVLSSKVYFQTSHDVNSGGLSRKHLMTAVEGSLRRLRTDYLDFYFVHYFDSTVAIEETLKTLDDLVRQGKVLYPAVSNWSAWQIAKALTISEHRGWARFECIQPMYSLVKGEAEVEILPLADCENVGVVTYGPLAGGLLSGKYKCDTPPDRGRLLSDDNYRRRYSAATYRVIADRFFACARKRGINPATLAVAWVKSHPTVTSVAIGARNVEQVAPLLEATNVEMESDWRTEVSALSLAPPPATDRSEETAPESSAPVSDNEMIAAMFERWRTA